MYCLSFFHAEVPTSKTPVGNRTLCDGAVVIVAAVLPAVVVTGLSATARPRVTPSPALLSAPSFVAVVAVAVVRETGGGDLPVAALVAASAAAFDIEFFNSLPSLAFAASISANPRASI